VDEKERNQIARKVAWRILKRLDSTASTETRLTIMEKLLMMVKDSELTALDLSIDILDQLKNEP
jgi:hypothetical protein